MTDDYAINQRVKQRERASNANVPEVQTRARRTLQYNRGGDGSLRGTLINPNSSRKSRRAKWTTGDKIIGVLALAGFLGLVGWGANGCTSDYKQNAARAEEIIRNGNKEQARVYLDKTKRDRNATGMRQLPTAVYREVERVASYEQ